VLAIAGDRLDPTAALCNHYIHTQQAPHVPELRRRPCAPSASGPPTSPGHTPAALSISALFPRAARVLLERVPKDVTEIDGLMNDPAMGSGEVVGRALRARDVGPRDPPRGRARPTRLTPCKDVC